MLELYEATYMSVQGEVILDDARIFTTTHLETIARDPLQCNSSLSKYIQEALVRPIRKRLPRLDSLSYIPFYEQQLSHNKSLLKLSKLGFNILQSLHKKELSQVSKWWKGFDVPKNLPYVRDRLVEVYFWIVGVYFEPEYSRARVILTKMIAMANVVDNTYDAYGTYEELHIFNQAVQRWSITCLEALPGYMKPIYKGLIDIHNEMEDILANDEKSHYINYAKEAMKEFVGSQMQEAEWRKTGYVPTVEEHKSVSFVSCGYMMLTISSFIGMDETTTDEPFQWVLANPPFVKATCAICRIMDDIVGYKINKFERAINYFNKNSETQDEQQRDHVVSVVECYMKHHNVTKVEHIYDLFKQEVEDAWKDMNQESLILLSDYDCEIRYHPGKANVVADTLSRKKREPPLRVRALVMTIGLNLPKQILDAQTEARKPENIKNEDVGKYKSKGQSTAKSKGQSTACLVWKSRSTAFNIGTLKD
ncbi:(-)-germacrene D synthase [Tanacetum coccineum]